MRINIKDLMYTYLHNELKVDCKNCYGICCAALYFSKSEGFPCDKDAGEPCLNLEKDFKCKIHSSLLDNGLKGCCNYECFGAGQKVAKGIYSGMNWIDSPEIKEEMFNVFLAIRQLYEMLCYLTQALKIEKDILLQDDIKKVIDETLKLTNENPNKILDIDMVVHRNRVNKLLLKTSEGIRSKIYKGTNNRLKNKKFLSGRLNLINRNLREVNLVGEDLSGALLIAANLSGVNLNGVDLLGADLRDTDLSGADLRNSIYITQQQINAAKGDDNTKLPDSLSAPSHWKK